MKKISTHEILRGTKEDLISYLETELDIKPYEYKDIHDRSKFTFEDQPLLSQLTNLVDNFKSIGCIFYGEQAKPITLESDSSFKQVSVTVTKLYVHIIGEK